MLLHGCTYYILPARMQCYRNELTGEEWGAGQALHGTSANGLHFSMCFHLVRRLALQKASCTFDF